MSVQHYLPEQPGTLELVITLSAFIKEEYSGADSPFKRESVFTFFKRRFFLALTYVLEKLLDVRLLKENHQRELSRFSAPARRLLRRLLEQKKVIAWDCGARAIDKPAVEYCSITVGKIRNEKGALLMNKGRLFGQGIGKTSNEALTVALAETIERIAITEFNTESLLFYSIDELKNRGINFFAHRYAGGLINSDVLIGWVKGVDLTTGGSCLLPASMVYLNYGRLTPSDPFFLETTSNACAAQTSKKKAIEKALYEGIERDGLLMYWLNRLTPNRIDTSTIEDLHIQNLLSALERSGIELHLCDCRTEFSVPIIVSVLKDTRTGGIDVNAAAGFDIDEVLRKSVTDAMRWGIAYTKPFKYSGNPEEIKTMNDRKHLWRGGVLTDSIDFFIKGNLTSYENYKNSFSSSVILKKGAEEIIEIFRKKGMSLYSVDVTNELASSSGLYVVRIISPDLVPIYFNESARHINVPRIYSFSKTMGYSDREITPEELNTVPHPFI